VWLPFPDFGLQTDFALVVTDVQADSAAARAGIRPGDRIDESAQPLFARYVTGDIEPAPGAKETVRVMRDGSWRTVTLVAEATPGGAQDVLRALLNRVFTGLAVIALGAALVLYRPSRMTWAFFLYCIGLAGGIDAGPYWLPPLVGLLNSVFYGLINAAGWIGFLVFCIRFPNDRATGRWHLIDRAAPALFVMYAVLTLLPLTVTFGYSAGAYAYLAVYVDYAIYALAVIALLATYRRGSPDERQRIRWVAAGLVFGIGGRLIGNALGIWWPNRPDFLNWIFLAQLAIPLSVVYAVIRYRVFDITFVVQRALVYAVLTALVVSAFALVDWFFVKKLVSTSAGLVAEVFVALAIGFTLNTLHKRVDWFVERTFFRRRYAAEQRLTRTATTLPHAVSYTTLRDLLTHEPVEAFELESGAVFERTTDGSFARRTATSWPDGSARTLSRDDPLVTHLEADPKTLRTRDIHWARSDLPVGAARPALALPILVRRRLHAIALYGESKSGAALDPDEIRAIGQLATAAGAAYDHLEAEALREQVADLQQRLTTA
jgi:hypothetical protein